MLQRFFFFIGEREMILAFLSYKLNRCYCLSQSPPNIIVFTPFFDYLETFQDIDNVIDTTAFDVELNSHLV